MTAARVTQQAVEVLYKTSAVSNVRVTQQAVEVMYLRYLPFAGNIIESTDITDWRINVTKASDGTLLTTDIFTGTTYSIAPHDAAACIITILPKINYSWTAGKVTALNDFVVATNTTTTPHLWKCTTAGTTHSTTEPTWNLSSTTTDNTTIWTYVAKLVNPITIGPKVPR